MWLVLFALLVPALVRGAEVSLLRKLNFIPEVRSVPAPDFATVDAQGRQVNRASYGGKVVILNFWATWCPPCRLEMPSMEKLYREFKDRGLEIVAVNFMESPEVVNEFVREQGITYPILIDRKARIAEAYGVMRLPETVLIGRRGNLLGKSTGYKDWYKPDVRKLVSSLLQDEEAVMRRARETVPHASSGRAMRDPYLMLAFGFALVLLLAYYLRRARGKKSDPAVHDA